MNKDKFFKSFYIIVIIFLGLAVCFASKINDSSSLKEKKVWADYHTDDKLSGYQISYFLDGGSLPSGKANPTSYIGSSSNFVLTNPIKEGYDFVGWTGTDLTTPTDFVLVDCSSLGNKNYVANWKARDDTRYTVKHWKQNTNGDSLCKDSNNYTLADTDTYVGVSDETFIGNTRSYEGFKTPSKIQTKIAANGSTILNYYYEAIKHTVTVKGDNGIKSVDGSGIYSYNSNVHIKCLTKPGYEFVGFEGTLKIDKNDTKLTMPNSDLYEVANTKPINYYINYDLDGGTLPSTLKNTTYYNVETNTFSIPNPVKDGYEFVGWVNENEGSNTKKDLTIYKGSTENLELKAIWRATGSTPYKIVHWKQNIGSDENSLDSNNYTIADTEELKGKISDPVEPNVKQYKGFTSPEVKSVYINNNGSTIINYYYTRNSYKLTLNISEGIESVFGEGTYQYGEEVNIKVKPKDGYTWEKWSGTLDISDSDTKLIMPAFDVNEYSNVNKIEEKVTPAKNIKVKEDNNITNTCYCTTNVANNEVDKQFAKYKVNYYLQENSEDKYSLEKTESLYASKGDTVTPVVYNFDGYTAPNKKSVKIASNGSTVINYYYKKYGYKLNIIKDDGIKYVRGEGFYQKGDKVELDVGIKDGYRLSDSQSLSFIMPDHDLTFYIKTEPIKYKISYYLDGGVLPEGKRNYSYYTASMDDFVLINPTKDGYIFKGWIGDLLSGPSTNVSVSTKNLGSKQYKAIWEKTNITKYIVNHYLQNTNGNPDLHDNSNYTLVNTDEVNTILFATVSPRVRNYEGFNSPNEKSIKVDKVNKVINYYYTRKLYSLKLITDDGVKSSNAANHYYYGSKVNIKCELKDGYIWNKWNNNLSNSNEISFTMPNYDVKIIGTTLKYKYFIKYDLEGGSLPNNQKNPTSYDVSSKFDLANPIKTGYDFVGWRNAESKDVQGKLTIDGSKSLGDINLIAVYKPSSNTKVTINHWLQKNINNGSKIKYNSDYFTLKDRDIVFATSGSNYKGQTKEYNGYKTPSEVSATVNPDGSTIINYYYMFEKNENVKVSTFIEPAGSKYDLNNIEFNSVGIVTISTNVKEKKAYSSNIMYTNNLKKSVILLSFTLIFVIIGALIKVIESKK